MATLPVSDAVFSFFMVRLLVVGLAARPAGLQIPFSGERLDYFVPRLDIPAC
jgi:hypothetical protein